MNTNDKIKELFGAIEASDVQFVKQLLDSGVAANSKNASGQTALTFASTKGNTEIIEVLIAAGAEINPETEPVTLRPQIYSSGIPGGWSFGELIAQATENADEATKSFYNGFMKVLDTFSAFKNHDINNEPRISGEMGEDENNESINEEEINNPLIAAIRSGNLQVVKSLIQAGVAINPQNWDEPVPLVVAVENGQLDIITVLVEAGANVNKFDLEYVTTPLGMAIEHERVDIVRTLLSAGASPEGGDECYTGLVIAINKNNMKIFQMLLDAGASVNGRMEDDYRAIMKAALLGRLEMVKKLVEAGADVNAWSQGETAIMSAARGAHQEVYDYLYPLVDDEIRVHADRHGEKEMQATVKRRERENRQDVEDFINAAMYGKLEEVKTAISDNVDVNAIDSNGCTALMYAANYGHIPVIQALLDAGADSNIKSDNDEGLGEGMTALMFAAGSFFAANRVDVVKLLVQYGADVNLKSKEGKTALMYAAGTCSGYTESVNNLINLGADLNIKDNDDNTALMQMELGNNTTIADVLRRAGATENGIAEVRLIKAAREGDIEQVKALIKNGTNVNHNDGLALCSAAGKGHQEVVEMLIQAGANVNTSTSNFTPLATAAYEGYAKIVQLLIQAGANIHVRCHDGDGYNAVEYAELGMHEGHHKGKGHAEIIRILKEVGEQKLSE